MLIAIGGGGDARSISSGGSMLPSARAAIAMGRGGRLCAWLPDLCALAVVALSIVLVGIFRLHFWHIRHPVIFSGDVGVVLEYIKNALQNGGTTIDPQIGYPLRGSLAAFPVFDTLSAGVLRCLSLFTSDPIVGANLLAYSDHLLSGLIGYGCFRALRVARVPAIACAVSFAYVEFALSIGRVFGHETLQLFAPLAVGATLALLPVVRPAFADSRRGLGTALLLGGFVGLAQPYWVAFTLLLLAASIVGSMSAGRFRPALFPAAGGAAMLTVAAVCLNWPRLFGGVALAIHRSPFDQLVFGLRLVNLFLPPRSTLSAVQQSYERYLANSGPLVEGSDAFMGWPGVFGAAFACILLLRAPFRSDAFSPRRAAEFAALFIVVLVLFTQSYGLGQLFNMFATPEIRAQNRVSPMVAFLATFIFADVAGRVGSRWQRGRALTHVAVPLVAVLGLYDQTAGLDYGAVQADSGTVQRWNEARAAAQAVSDTLPRPAAILQLPIMPYPESPGVGTLGSYDEMDLPLLTRGYRYSFGSMSAGLSLLAQHEPITTSIDAALMGFDEVLFYRGGYPEGLEATIEALENGPHIRPNLETSEFIGFDVRPLRTGSTPVDPDLPGLKVRTNWEGQGFGGLEHDPTTQFRWDDSYDGKGVVAIDNDAPTPVRMRFCGTIWPGTPGTYEAAIDAAGQVFRRTVGADGTVVDLTFEIPRGRSQLLVHVPVPRLVTPPAEQRRLHFQVRSPLLVPVDLLDRLKQMSPSSEAAMPAACRGASVP